MAPPKAASDFETMIHADRERRKASSLAQEILGKGRRSSAPGAGVSVANRKPGTGPSLASRIGVAKRIASTKPVGKNARQPKGDVEADWTHDLHSVNNSPASGGARGSRQATTSYRVGRADRLHSAIHGSASSPALNSQFKVVAPRASMSIRGIAGPYIVMAKNFAHGTTAADIESAMTPVGGIILGCRLIAERPKVIAEIIFETKEGADNVVETFNNQSADGHLLHVFHKVGSATPQASIPQPTPAIPSGPRSTRLADQSNGNLSSYNGSERYPQDQSRERRRDYETRAEVIDGSYGFDDRMDTDDREDDRNRANLYSDNLVNKRGRGHSLERGRGNPRRYN
ncbi:hypothetical protein B0O99DRAFT_58870 [Bisporella sp. PMI_857]|nr:hypothetical protein B0O99DRAFT_58870 [Bisporella sp. PMI_857]